MVANNQTPVQEAVERLGESMPGLAMIPKMIATVGLDKQQEQYRRYVEDSQRIGMEAVRKVTGLKTQPIEPPKEDDNMASSYSVAGDTTTVHNHYYPPAPQPAAQPETSPAVQPTAPPAASAPASPAPVAATPTEQTTPAWKTWLARSALAAGGLAAGAGGLAGYNWLTAPEANEKPPTVEQPADPQGTPQALPYTPPTIIGPGISTEKWNFLPGEQP